jgi:hypothetical protein
VDFVPSKFHEWNASVDPITRHISLLQYFVIIIIRHAIIGREGTRIFYDGGKAFVDERGKRLSFSEQLCTSLRSDIALEIIMT